MARAITTAAPGTARQGRSGTSPQHCPDDHESHAADDGERDEDSEIAIQGVLLRDRGCRLNFGGSVAKGYWVSAYRSISDPEKVSAYDKLARAAVEAGGGRVLSRGARVVAYDAGIAERFVLIEFDSFEQAVAARASAAYQEALAELPDGFERDFRIIEGLD